MYTSMHAYTQAFLPQDSIEISHLHLTFSDTPSFLQVGTLGCGAYTIIIICGTLVVKGD